MSGKSSQRKGRSGKLELCRLLQGYGIPAEPGTALNYGKEPDIKGVTEIHCECKRAEQLRLSEWMTQAGQDAQWFGDGLPAVFFRRNREGCRVVMNLSDWMQLYEKAHTCKCGGRCNEGSTGDGR